MTDAALWLFSSGSWNFVALTESPDFGDVWIVEQIELQGANYQTLYTIPKFDGPRMDGQVSVDAWGVFPAEIMAYLFTATLFSHC